jgi:acyl-CoA synthetase (AMP-forming)/AMP-acid ligase II
VATTPKNRNLIKAWNTALEKRPNALFHQVLAQQGGYGTTHSLSSVLRNAIRYADGIRSVSNLKAGDKVAMLADGFGELVPLYHAFWLLGIVVVAVSNTTPAEVAVAQINNLGCRGLVYTPSLAARLASIIPKISGIDFWLLVGVGRSGPLGGGTPVTRLEDLLQSSSRDVKLDDFDRVKQTEDSIALVAFTSGEVGEPKGVGFTETALLHAALNQSTIYSIGTQAERFASLLPNKHLVTIVHSVVVPLVAPLTSVVMPEIASTGKIGNLVGELYDNQVQAVLLREELLEEIRTASKSQKFVLAKNFKAFLIPQRPLPAKQLEGISNLIVPCFSQTECGGIIATGTQELTTTSKTSTVEKIAIVSGGSAISGVSIKVVGQDGTPVKFGEIGELTVTSAQVMHSYCGGAAGSAYVTPDLALHTGDRVQTQLALDGTNHIVMVGREDHFIMRGEKEVNLFELESVIRRVVGVKEVRVVGFPHIKLGKELGAFVLLQKKAQVTREALWSNLLAFFPWDVVPKVFMIADAALVPNMPTRADIEDKLGKFSSSDFSRPPKLT